MGKITLGLLLLTVPLVAADFEINFYQSVAPDSGNFLIAPQNVANTLSMAYLGAEGETQAEMAKVLGFGTLTKEEVAAKYGKLPPETSALWLPEGQPLRLTFRTLVTTNYPDGLHEALFEQPTIVTHEINGWMSGKTAGHVPRLLEETSINSASSMVLVGAFLPEEKWLFPFSPSDTTANMMNIVAPMPYLALKDYTMVAIPYEGQRALVVILPNHSNIQPQITADLLRHAMNDMEIKNVKLSLPKFKASTRVFSRQFLQELGMKTAFTQGANFSGIDGQLDLYISQIVHQASFSVDEVGTGATGSQSQVNSSVGKPFDATFTVDRPFAYVLVDANSGNYLIMGRYSPGN